MKRNRGAIRRLSARAPIKKNLVANPLEGLTDE